MNKLEELNMLLDDYRRLKRVNPRLIVLGNESLYKLRKLQQEGFVQLEYNHKNNGETFNGIRVLLSQESNHEEISFY